MNKLRIFLSCLFGFSALMMIDQAMAFRNIAYVETNDNALQNVACYVQTSEHNQPFFDTAVIFAVNIHGDEPNIPVIYLNPQDDKLLNHTQQVAKLKAKGIKVLAAVLGDHQNAGWSCVTNHASAKAFAQKIVEFVNKYNLDGIAVDDEYSNCSANENSMVSVIAALKQNPQFKGRIVQKVLLPGDEDQFSGKSYNSSVTLANVIDSATPGYYPGSSSVLEPYTQYDMSRNDLYASVSTVYTDSDQAKTVAQQAISHGWGGLMVFNVTADNKDYLNAIEQGEFGKSDVGVLPNCLVKSKPE